MIDGEEELAVLMLETADRRRPEGWIVRLEDLCHELQVEFHIEAAPDLILDGVRILTQIDACKRPAFPTAQDTITILPNEAQRWTTNYWDEADYAGERERRLAHINRYPLLAEHSDARWREKTDLRAAIVARAAGVLSTRQFVSSSADTTVERAADGTETGTRSPKAPIGHKERYLLGVLLTKVDEHIGVFWSFEELTRPGFSDSDVRLALDLLEDHDLALFSTISTPEAPRNADPMIQLTTRGLAYCLMHEGPIIRAAMDGDVEQLIAVREAYERLRSRPSGVIDSSLWTGLSRQMDPQITQEIRAGVRTLVEVIQQSDLPKAARENAMAYALAVEELVKAPEPPWKVIVDLLTSKPLTAFLNASALVILILQMLA